MVQAVPGSPADLAAPSHCPLYHHGAVAFVAPVLAISSDPVDSPFHPAQIHSRVETERKARNLAFQTHAVRGPPYMTSATSVAHIA